MSDPYTYYRYELLSDPAAVPLAGFSKMSMGGLRLAASGVHAAPFPIARLAPVPVTLEAGTSSSSDFNMWAQSAFALVQGQPSQAVPRRMLQLAVRDEAGQIAKLYRLRDCWVSQYLALPDLDAGGNAVAIQHVRIETQGLTYAIVLQARAPH